LIRPEQIVFNDLCPARIIESLDFQQIAVGVAEKAMIDPEIRVMCRRFFKLYSEGLQLLIPSVHIPGDQRYDDVIAGRNLIFGQKPRKAAWAT